MKKSYLLTAAFIALISGVAAVSNSNKANAGPLMNYYKGHKAIDFCIEKMEVNRRALEQAELIELQAKRSTEPVYAQVNEARAAKGLQPVQMPAFSVVESIRAQQELDWHQTNCHNVMAQGGN